MKHLLIGICFIVIILITSITPPQAHCSTMTTTPKIISVSKDTFNLTQYRLKNEALKWVGYKETGNNRGKDVDSWNHYCGVALGSPYCSSFVSYLIRLCKIILNNVSNYRTARAKDWLKLRYIKAIDVYKKISNGISNGLVIYSRQGGGHVGVFISADSSNRCRFSNVEANTSPSRTGSQHNGSGIWLKNRTIEPYNHSYRVIAFVPIEE